MTSRPVLLALFMLTATTLSAQEAELQLVEDKNTIRVLLGGKPVLRYVKTDIPAPDGLSPLYRRSGYIHPVYSPGGQQVTGDFPLDHPHQHALFFAWTRATFQDQRVDFWNQLADSGRIEHRRVTGRQRQADRVSFTAEHAFVIGALDERTDVLNETWKVTVYATPADHFLFDIESVQRCATETPLTVEQYHYGGMAIRGNAQWFDEQADDNNPPGGFAFLTSEGKNRRQGNHTRPHWVAMTGDLDGEPASLAVMCSPRNFRSPQPVRLHPTKPYFCFSPMVTGAFAIQPGKPYVSRYRYLVRSAAADADFIEKRWREYSAKEAEAERADGQLREQHAPEQP